MTDPREKKLPKWAQELLEQERVKSALAWPREPRPEPLWKPGVNTHAPREFEGKTVWQALPPGDVQECVVIRGYVYTKDGAAFGFRPEQDRYFATCRDALLYCLWMRAETAAKRLRLIQQRIDAEDAQ